MDQSLAQIIITAITVCVPALVTLITSKKLKKQANKHSTRSDIMQLIIEDHVRVMEGTFPENYQAIMDEFTEYQASGGNKYIDGKIEDYKEWYKSVNKKGVNSAANSKTHSRTIKRST